MESDRQKERQTERETEIGRDTEPQREVDEKGGDREYARLD